MGPVGGRYRSRSLRFDRNDQASAKNASPPLSLGGIASNLVLGKIRVIELELVDRFFMPPPVQKISWVRFENMFSLKVSNPTQDMF